MNFALTLVGAGLGSFAVMAILALLVGHHPDSGKGDDQ